ncbi:MAG: formate dehydrogenase, partial [Advenella sp.]
MTIRIFIPADAAAIAAGAERVVAAISKEAAQRNQDITVVRNGSRGLLWLEPMIEVQTENGRVAYGPVKARDVPSLFDADFLHGGHHTLAHGLTEEIPFLKKQERLTFARVGITDPLSITDYMAHG